MLGILKQQLKKALDDIDAGNSNLTEEQELKLVETFSTIFSNNNMFSKYQAAQYLNVSRATFDNYIKQGKLPKGQKQPGFKKLRWSQQVLDEYIKKFKQP